MPRRSSFRSAERLCQTGGVWLAALREEGLRWVDETRLEREVDEVRPGWVACFPRERADEGDRFEIERVFFATKIFYHRTRRMIFYSFSVDILSRNRIFRVVSKASGGSSSREKKTA